MKKYSHRQVFELTQSISTTVILLTLFLLYGLCGKVENSVDVTKEDIVFGIALIVIGIVACVTYNIKLGKEDKH